MDVNDARAWLDDYPSGHVADPEVTADAVTVVLLRLAELELAARPSIDLAPLKHPTYEEWGWGGAWAGRQHRVTAGLEPDVGGYLVQLYSRGVTRDELPDLIAFLAAVHAQSDPAELEKRYDCDCFPDDEPHESWCATFDRPTVQS